MLISSSTAAQLYFLVSKQLNIDLQDKDTTQPQPPPYFLPEPQANLLSRPPYPVFG